MIHLCLVETLSYSRSSLILMELLFLDFIDLYKTTSIQGYSEFCFALMEPNSHID